MRIEIISDDRYILKTSSIDKSYKHLAREAWELSRSKDDETPLNRILSIDAPVNEIPSLVLNIECTIMEREIFASYRDHVMWARTSRVDNPLEFRTDPWFYTYMDEIDSLKKEIKKQAESGVIQDEYRMLIPLCAKTSFTTRVSWRGLIKIYKHFEYLATVDDYFRYTVLDMQTAFGLDEFKNNYSYVNPIPMLERSEQKSGKLGPIITVFQEMTIALRAQVVRHRNFTIKDNLFGIISEKDFWIKTLGDKIKISISAETEFWKTVINKRQCWIAQYGIWKDIIVEAQKYININEDNLPCAGGSSCPYTRDAELRHTDKDPGAPCPIHSKLHNMPIPKHKMDSVHIEASYRPAFWKKHIENVNIGE
jgi:hypothetical protein|tara:strand:- start:21591 stop:22688 length:1098 start_codon:yes stop_codon:yes gene_type:complete